jgi:hypothetical protein
MMGLPSKGMDVAPPSCLTLARAGGMREWWNCVAEKALVSAPSVA